MVARRIAAADPIVTFDGGWLRFESLSQCGGVHARLDVDASGLELARGETGTTNVDVNPPLASALAQVVPGEPMRLSVGRDEVRVELLDGVLVEKRVSLPERWVRGLGESQVQVRAMEPRVELRGPPVRSVARDVPRAGRGVVYVEAAARGLRLTSRPGRLPVALSGADRMAPLLPLLRFADRLVIHAADEVAGGASSAWEVALPTARFTLTVSADPSRGFSGEGGLLAALADDELDDSDSVLEVLGRRPVSSMSRIARVAGLSTDRARRAVDVLSASGLIGFDVGEQGSFRRRLPYGAALERLNPRLASSRALLDAGALSLDASDDLRVRVASGDHHHQVRLGPGGSVSGAWCTCRWYARTGGARGPCKHVLAAAQFRKRRDADG